MSTLTLKEQERRAYIAGDTERAALLAELVELAELIDAQAGNTAAVEEARKQGYDAGYAKGWKAGVLGWGEA